MKDSLHYASDCCAICVSLYEDKDIVVWSDQCQHIFHRDCLVQWLMKDGKSSCPCCRQRFSCGKRDHPHYICVQKTN